MPEVTPQAWADKEQIGLSAASGTPGESNAHDHQSQGYKVATRAESEGMSTSSEADGEQHLHRSQQIRQKPDRLNI